MARICRNFPWECFSIIQLYVSVFRILCCIIDIKPCDPSGIFWQIFFLLPSSQILKEFVCKGKDAKHSSSSRPHLCERSKKICISVDCPHVVYVFRQVNMGRGKVWGLRNGNRGELWSSESEEQPPEKI